MRRALGPLLSLLAVVAAVLPAHPAGAQQATAPEVRLASQTTWVAAGEVFRLGLDVRQPPGTGPLDVEVSLHPAVRSRSEYARTLEGALLGRSTAEATVGIGPEGGPVEVVLSQTGDAFGTATDVGELAPGVYPVSVRLRARGGPVVDDLTTHLVRTHGDPALPPLSVALVVPFGAPPALRPDGSTTISREWLDRLAGISDAVAVDGAPLTLAPTPETLVALDELDHDDVLDGLRRSVADGSQVLAGPYVELSPAALAEPRLEADVDAQRLQGAAALESLLDAAPDVRTLTAPGPVDEGLLGALDDLGITTLVLTEEALDPLDPVATRNRTLVNPFLVDVGEGEPVRAVSADTGLMRAFDAGDDPVLAAHHLLADLAVLFGDFPGLRRGVVVLPPRGWEPDGTFLRTVVEGLAADGDVAPATVATVLEQVPPLEEPGGGERVVRSVVEEPAGQVDATAISVSGSRAALAAVGNMVGAGNADLARMRRQLLVSQAAQLTADQRRAYTGAVQSRTSSLVGGVSILERGSYRLTARQGTIPVTLRNDNEFPVDVLLRLASDKIEFADADTDDPDGRGLLVEPVTLDPGNNFIAVEVIARTSGDFPLQLDLSSPDGVVSIDRTRVTVRSTVASGVGVALSIGAGLFLLVWWGRHWRTVRRDRRLVHPDVDAEALVAAADAADR